MIRKQVFPLIFRACVPNLPVYISRHSKMTVLWSFAFSLFSKQIFQVMASRRDPGGPRKLLETIREKQVRWSNVKRQFSLQVCTTRCKNVIHLNSRMSRSKYNLPVLIQAWQDILLCFFKIPWILSIKWYRFNSQFLRKHIFPCLWFFEDFVFCHDPQSHIGLSLGVPGRQPYTDCRAFNWRSTLVL